MSDAKAPSPAVRMLRNAAGVAFVGLAAQRVASAIANPAQDAAAAAAATATTAAASSGTSAAAAATIHPPHPGTAAWRENCEITAVSPREWEQRFIATAPLLAGPVGSGGDGGDGGGGWDFIVVGAGSAGCVLAARLAEMEKPGGTGERPSVLLVECGGEAQNAAAVRDPMRAPQLWRSEADWHFQSTPQPQLLPAGRSIDLERGKTLGGSSCLNWSMWVR